MAIQNLESQFARIGARVKLEEELRPVRGGSFSLDVQRDRRGEFFAIRLRPGQDLRVDVVDERPADRHLLLLVEERGVKQKFLCGHDERHWFVAAIPEAARGVTGVVASPKSRMQPA